MIRRTAHVRYAQVSDFGTQRHVNYRLNSLSRAEVSCFESSTNWWSSKYHLFWLRFSTSEIRLRIS